jgi:hypothetical protein
MLRGQRFIVAISRVHTLITLPSATGGSRKCFATNKWHRLNSDVGDGAYYEQPNVRTHDELAREMEMTPVALDSLERADTS